MWPAHDMATKRVGRLSVVCGLSDHYLTSHLPQCHNATRHSGKQFTDSVHVFGLVSDLYFCRGCLTCCMEKRGMFSIGEHWGSTKEQSFKLKKSTAPDWPSRRFHSLGIQKPLDTCIR